MKTNTILFFLLIVLLFTGCSKSDFLDKKPNTGIVQPTSFDDFQKLLDNTQALPVTGGLAQISGDEYEVTSAVYNSASPTERNAYIWAKDIYAGSTNIKDWNDLYTVVFIANNVLTGVSKTDSLNTAQGRFIKGWALFTRAFAFYDLTRIFCKAYDENTAHNDLGIPLKLSPNIDEIEQRASLQKSYDQIFADLQQSLQLLPSDRPSSNLNRPSKIAAYALYARIYLDMRKYGEAGIYADSCLALYDKLIDYNTLDTMSSVPFSVTNDELIYNCRQVGTYGSFSTTFDYAIVNTSPQLIELYSPGDLRIPLFYTKNSTNVFKKKQGYSGFGVYPFTGLATDEIYLIKAECKARERETTLAMQVLNALLIKRYKNDSPFTPLTANTPEEALRKILLERRKELAYRGLRWYDLKRLNMEGANITLTRDFNGNQYTLEPNSVKYVFPIPDDEISLSGIEQNNR